MKIYPCRRLGIILSLCFFPKEIEWILNNRKTSLNFIKLNLQEAAHQERRILFQSSVMNSYTSRRILSSSASSNRLVFIFTSSTSLYKSFSPFENA